MNIKKPKYKVIYSFYDPQTGLSSVTITTNKGNFTGYSKIRGLDKDKPSSFVGCRNAEAKAVIKYYKFQKQQLQMQYKTLKDFYYSIIKAKHTNPNGFEMNRLKQAMEQISDNIKVIDEYIIHLSDKYREMFKAEYKKREQLNRKG